MREGIKMTEQEIKTIHAESFKAVDIAITEFDRALDKHPFKSNLKHTVVLGLAHRLIEFSRGSEAMGRMGLAAANAAMVRMCLETVYKLKAICIGSIPVEDYAKQKEIAQRQSLKRVLKLDSLPEILTTEQQSEYRSELQEIEKLFAPKTGIPEIKISDWADKAGEGIPHAFAYSALSDYVHSGISSLAHIIEVRDDGQVFIQTGPSAYQLESNFEGIRIYLAVAIDAIEQMFADENS